MPYSWLEGRPSRLELKRPSHMARRKPRSENSRATPQKEPDISVSILSLAFFCERNKTCILFKLSYVGDSVTEKLMVQQQSVTAPFMIMCQALAYSH